MTTVLLIIISILSSFLGFLVYRLMKLDNQFKLEKSTCDVYRERYSEINADQDRLNDILESKNSEISSLKRELSSLKDLDTVPVTRIETYTPQMKVIKYSTELCPSDFGDMPKEQIIELAKDELYKNMFELIKPHILVIKTDDIYHMRTVVSGKIVVSDRGGKE